jgi:uncharacterized protein YfaP (DUF2135 family)
VVLVALAAACARRAVVPAASPAPAGAGVVVTLTWTAPVDLDLYVTDPGLETVYFANPRSRSGGALEGDARCADAGGRAREERIREERIRWTEPPPGRYRVGVDYIEACARAAREVSYRVTVDSGGRREETTGRARRAERAPRVLEFTVPGGTPGEGRP